MSNIKFDKIISEELEKFDFLGNDEHLKEQETNDLLQNEDLQKQFICDSLLTKNNKINITQVVDSSITGNWSEDNFDNANRIALEYSIKVDYRYDSTKDPLSFNLDFSSESINISVDGWSESGNGYDKAPEEDAWYDEFDWNDIDVTIFNSIGDEVKFTAFENAPPRIQTLFIRDYTQNFIENETLNIKTPEVKDNGQSTEFC